MSHVYPQLFKLNTINLQTHTEAGVQCFPSYLEDLLLQAVDSQRSFGEIQTHAVVPNTVNHV